MYFLLLKQGNTSNQTGTPLQNYVVVTHHTMICHSGSTNHHNNNAISIYTMSNIAAHHNVFCKTWSTEIPHSIRVRL